MSASRTLSALGSALICTALAGCGGVGQRPAALHPATANWRSVATDADRERLRNWRSAWMSALAQVRASPQAKTVAAIGPLLDPDRALDGAMPPAGAYRCRVLKLGSKGTSGAAYTSYPFFDCRIEAEGEVLSFYKTTGSQRPVGLLFRDTDARAIFLGTLVLGDEQTPLQYGQDAARDIAGYVERVGDRRWRLVMPLPAFESLVDVIELVPTP